MHCQDDIRHNCSMPGSTEQYAVSSEAAEQNPGGFKHVPALDGIRGLAILLVLVHHLLWANNNTGSSIFNVFQEIRGAAYCGVFLFFALSGFLITGILLDTLNIPHFYRTFYARRLLRIFPLYYGALIALILLSRPLHFAWSGWQYYYLTYTSNLALWRWNVPLQLGSFNIYHFWSLQVEEQFYLIWPFIVFRVRRLETLIRISLISCTVILCLRIVLVMMRGHPHFGDPYIAYRPTFACADQILFGCALCAGLRTRWRTMVTRLAPRVLTVIAVLLLIAFIRYQGLDPATNAFVPTLGYTLMGLSGAAMITMTLQAGSRAQRLFQIPFLRFFGKYSYGIYLFHYSLDTYLAGPLRAFLNTHLHSKALSVGLGAVAIASISVLVALVSYRFYEVPFLRLKGRFSYARPA